MKTLSAVLTLAALAVAFFATARTANGQAERKDVAVVVVERIQDLNLTDAQEAKIADIRKEYKTKVQAEAKSLSTLAKEEVEKVEAVLTPEQKKKLAELKEERKELRAERLSERIAHLEELDLTDAEVAKIMEIRKECRPKIEKAMQGLEGLLTAEQKKARTEALEAGKKRKEVLASLKLTDDQKAKVEAACKEVGMAVREELEKMRDVLTE